MPSPQDFHAFVIDDDAEIRASLCELLETVGWTVSRFALAREALKAIKSNPPDAMVLDVQMPGMSGLELLAELRAVEAPPVILISAHGDIPMAVQAMQEGAYTFLEKPYDPRRLLSALTHAAEQHRLRQSATRLQSRLASLSGLDALLLGQTQQIDMLRKTIADVAQTDVPVLIQGETGVGKDLVATALHRASTRSEVPMVTLNCATLTPDRANELFFDPSEGSLIHKAKGGTLFLDEVAACPVDVQPMLLRLIEAGDTGGHDPADVRFVSATNQNLDTALATGHMRQDLYYRLNLIEVNVPPLRDRKDDIILLFEHFCADYAAAHKAMRPHLTQDDIAALLAFEWPGNVRQLRGVALRHVLQGQRNGPLPVALSIDPSTDEAPQTPHTLRQAVAAFEREMIARALRDTDGNMDDVAQTLGIGRRTLNEKIVKLGL
ncbi:sigma-54-dependent transcriptional regulator [Algirhabdus cladophorae]|uniref:sigma-54-dependent transcriptional regulator n=1 Tax=Algirhabdus cladophorae TaxID=3377108 RepID=UPI003B845954